MEGGEGVTEDPQISDLEKAGGLEANLTGQNWRDNEFAFGRDVFAFERPPGNRLGQLDIPVSKEEGTRWEMVTRVTDRCVRCESGVTLAKLSCPSSPPLPPCVLVSSHQSQDT